ncbi:MAG: large conductance mechanosensitive channel protein MscL [Alphaproteobacteria bacterium]|nr:large conductance mechanosensitive channel protein MscL [Alphaproteobacteria bacterium]
MMEEFKKFALKGNMLDMAVGIVIGGAFATIIGSLVSDMIMPPIGLMLGDVDFAQQFILLQAGETPPPYLSLDAAKEAGAVTMNYGLFINAIISFLIIAFAIFMLVRQYNKLKAKEEEAPKAPPAPPKEEVLLTEIRDLLKAGR